MSSDASVIHQNSDFLGLKVLYSMFWTLSPLLREENLKSLDLWFVCVGGLNGLGLVLGTLYDM